ncbi:MAG: hypothetical protein V4455_04510 [Pseudomonadota bacterium]
MQTHVSIPCNDTPLLNVRAPGDIEFLVKESEVLTGKPGRTFVIVGADRLNYRVQWHPMGAKVERLDAHGQALSSEHLLPWEFPEHSVVQALRAGQLFTPLVRRPG